MTTDPAYRRIMLKLSGQALSGRHGYGIDREIIHGIASTLKTLCSEGMEISVVVGAGNLLRGTEAARDGMDRATADYAGMLGTVINSLVIQDMLESMGVETRVQSAITMNEVAEPFIRRRAMRHLEKGRVVIFAAGTGNPFFTTDTAAVLRATEIGAEVVIKATNVDGVYDDDPKRNSNATLLTELTFTEALHKGLRIMDATALSLAMENGLPILVLNIGDPDNIRRALHGETIGTLVRGTTNG